MVYAVPKSPTEWLLTAFSLLVILAFGFLCAWQFAAIQGWARGHWILFPVHYWYWASLLAIALLWWLGTFERDGE
jgi:hypothetical protein